VGAPGGNSRDQRGEGDWEEGEGQGASLLDSLPSWFPIKRVDNVREEAELRERIHRIDMLLAGSRGGRGVPPPPPSGGGAGGGTLPGAPSRPGNCAPAVPTGPAPGG
jgi:hypothetical protein